MDAQERFLRAVSYAVSKGQWLGVHLRKAGSTIVARITANIERLEAEDKVRIATSSSTSSAKDQAVAWATAMGYPVPSKLDGCLAAILVVIGLCIFVIPGVLLLVWLFVQSNQYEQDMKKLMEKWIDAGRPAPGEGIKEVTRLERIVEKVDNSAPQAASTEQRLLELTSMKEKGLITEEEYQAMRKKVLDL